MTCQSKLVQWNCEGLKQKGDALQEIIREKNPLCICLQETKLPKDADFHIRGYKSFLKNLETEGNAHGGVGVWVKNSKPAHQIPLNTNLQAVAVSLIMGKRVTICSLYLPPNEVIPRQAIENLVNQLPKPFLLLGDFNAHSPLWFDRRECARGKVIQKIIEDRDIFLLDQDKFTHVSRAHQTFSHIDLSIVSLDLIDDFDWEADDYYRTSDHAPIYITSRVQEEHSFEKRWIMNKAEWDKYTEKTEVDRGIGDFNTVEEAVEYLGEVILEAAEQSIPKSKGSGGRINPPWWNDDCRKAINKRKAAWKKYKSTISLVNLIAFKKAKAEAQRTVRRSKRASWSEFIEGIDDTTSTTEAWRRINILQGKRGGRKTSSLKVGEANSSLIIENIDLQTDAKDILQECYVYGPVHKFQESSEGTRKKLDVVFQTKESMETAHKELNGLQKDGKTLHVYPKPEVEESQFLDDPKDIADTLGMRFEYVSSYVSCEEAFRRTRKRREGELRFRTRRAFDYNSPITEEELKRELEGAKKTAPGPDGIHYSMLKNLTTSAKLLLLQILNKILSTGKLPRSWKTAYVIPILKEGKDPLKPDSYRPIALTSCICKLFEKILNRRLVRYLMEKKLISEAQAGFMKGKSTLDNLVALEKEVHETFIKKQYLITIFFDLAKAYDTCWRHLILKELYDSGMRGNLPIIIADFLTDRKFHVKIGEKISDQFSQDMGVPQGSVLSVILFLIAINTVSRIVSHYLRYSLYVDDMRVSIPVFSGDWSRASRRMQVFLDKLVRWCKETGFRFSEEKTVVMIFHRIPGLAAEPNPKLYLYDRAKPLKIVLEKRFLGLVWDRKLNWCAHLKDLRIRGMRANNILKVIIKNNSRTHTRRLMNIYRSIVRAKLDYGCQVYGTAAKSALKMLDTVHHQALRLCTGAFRTSPVESLYVEAGEPSLNDRRDLLSLQYYIRACRLPNSMVMKCLKDASLDNRYANAARKPKALSYKIRQLTASLGVTLPRIEPMHHCSLGPWQLPKTQCCLAMTSNNKDETSAEVYWNLFQSHKHIVDIEIYTDGSKGENGVGAAAIILKGNQRVELTRKLHDISSIFTAELLAIEISLVNIKRFKDKSCVVYTDSLSSIQAIQGSKVDDRRIGAILETIAKLDQQNVTVCFCWIPGHAGIRGNEEVDLLAKRACRKSSIDKAVVPSTDCKAYIKQVVKKRWQNRWENITDNKKLRSIQQSVDKKIRKLTRLDDIKLTRLRIGHTRLTHGHLLLGEDPPVCIECEVPMTVKHILIDCGNNIIDRLEFYDHRSVTLETLLNSSEEIPKVLNFLKRVEIYKEI